MSENQAFELAKLSEYDFVVVVDKSGSMGEEDCPGGKSRWDYVQESAVAFARDIGKIDDDGIGIVLFSGSSTVSKNNAGHADVSALFKANRPSGSTPLAQALAEALKLKASKPMFIAVFTDGIPDDKAAVIKVIVDQANSQEKDEDCTFLFVQVGYDKAAAAFLAKLDDDLQPAGAKFDIVDAMTMEEFDAYGSITDLIVKAIND